MLPTPRGSRIAPLVVLLALAAASCGRAPVPGDADPPPGDGLAVVDAEGRTVRLPEPAHRVVSLVPSVTETLRALDVDSLLVARTDYDTAVALAGLPSVGGGLGPDLEVLGSLSPDLVIRFAGDSDRATPRRLDDLGIPHAAVRPDRIEDVWIILDQLGSLLGIQLRTDSLARVLSDQLDRIREQVAGRPPVRAAYLMGGSPPWTAGGGTYIDELITLAGGVNIFSDVEGLYGALSPEVVATREVDVVLLAEGARIDPRLLEGRTVRSLPGVVELPGPGLADAAEAVARALHPNVGSSR